LFLPQLFESSADDSAIQSSVLGDSFVSIIKDVIRGLEDDHTQKELRADASRAKERPPVVAQEDVSNQPTTYTRRAKKQK
jgi:hypothetical protein